jgi:hypothetical protein
MPVGVPRSSRNLLEQSFDPWELLTEELEHGLLLVGEHKTMLVLKVFRKCEVILKALQLRDLACDLLFRVHRYPLLFGPSPCR